MDLRELLELLPVEKDGCYYELRKQDHWTCAETNMRTNMDGCTRVGRTPEEAVLKMLVWKEILIGCSNCLHLGTDHVPGCVFCQCRLYVGAAVKSVPAGRGATTADMERRRATS